MPTVEVPTAVAACHDLLKWTLPVLDRMPRTRRHTLGMHLENKLLATLEHLVIASYARDKVHELDQANRQLSVARHLWRLCMELNLISQQRYQYGAGLMVELGRQVGGWLKHAGA